MVWHKWDLASPEPAEVVPLCSTDRLQERKKLIRGNAGVPPNILDALQDADGRELARSGVALGVQALEESGDRRELGALVRTVQAEQVPGKCTGVNVKPAGPILGARFGKSLAERRAGLKPKRGDVGLRYHVK